MPHVPVGHKKNALALAAAATVATLTFHGANAAMRDNPGAGRVDAAAPETQASRARTPEQGARRSSALSENDGDDRFNDARSEKPQNAISLRTRDRSSTRNKRANVRNDDCRRATRPVDRLTTSSAAQVLRCDDRK